MKSIGPVRARVLRLVPDASSGDTVAPVDVARALGISIDAADQHFTRALRAGLVVRVRVGAYQLAAQQHQHRSE